jgi:hypothetical protein
MIIRIFVKIYLLDNKSEVYAFLKEYVNEAECHFNTKVKRIRCDDGGECRSKGIVI